MLTIDGGQGEGGGQILRTALSLAMVTGTPFRIDRIRAGRAKPGLLRQHLTCVHAAKEIAHAKVLGDSLGSTSLVFEPHAIKGGSFDFAIGSAGSTALVLQTVLPALLLADAPSRVTLSGGTHVPAAPTFEYLSEVFLPLLARMGVHAEIKLQRPGFYPAGGGRVHARIEPAKKILPLELSDGGEITLRRIRASVANLPFEIAERESANAVRLLSWPPETAEPRSMEGDGPGNLLAVTVGSEHVTEMFTGFGARGVSAEALVETTVREVRDYLVAKAPVGPHLADQLLLPMAMAGGGTFVTCAPSAHTRTSIAVIEKFLPVEIAAEPIDEPRWRITISS